MKKEFEPDVELMTALHRTFRRHLKKKEQMQGQEVILSILSFASWEFCYAIVTADEPKAVEKEIKAVFAKVLKYAVQKYKESE